MFTLTPFNNFDDLEHVAKICKKHDIDLRIGIYNTMDYFDIETNKTQNSSLDYSIDKIPGIVHNFKENYDLNEEVFKFLASEVTTSIREMVGALNRILAILFADF